MPSPSYKSLSIRNIAIGLSLSLAGCATNTGNLPPSQALSCQLPDQDSLASIIRVSAGNDNASSGVVIGKDSVLTVAHAVPEGLPVSIQVNGETRIARPIAISEELDLALLDVATDEIPPLEIADQALQVNEHVWAVGFPLARDQRTSLGVIQQQAGSSVITSAHISSGTSGGGLLRCSQEKFELAGIVKAYLAYEIAGDIINSGDSVAVSAETVSRFVNRAARYGDQYSANGSTKPALEISTSYTLSP